MVTDSERFDVAIVGGGPAGSVCAASLARRGFRVIVLERTRFPRFHLGESLLPQSLPVLAEIGVLPKIEETFIWKYGARFHDDEKKRKERFEFAGAWQGELDHAFEVPRDEFDRVLLEHARASGADVREEHTATRLTRGEVLATAKSGEGLRIEARIVVDATGRDAMTAHEARGTRKIEGLEQTAIYTQYRGVPRPEGKAAGDIDIVLFPDVDGRRPNWFWLIPFKDGRTSVGAVVSRAWLQRNRGEGPPDLFASAVASSPTACRPPSRGAHRSRRADR